MSILLKNAKLFDNLLVNILIDQSFISYIGKEEPYAGQILDLEGKLVLPGAIDVHAHLRDMALADKEDWLSGSRAAAAGGITTLMDMPNTIPPTFDRESLRIKREAAAKSVVNYGFNFGVNSHNLNEVRKAENINAIKMFMAESSSGRVIGQKSKIREIFSVAREIDKPVIVHSELQSCIEEYAQRFEAALRNHNTIRNRECAIKSTEIVLQLALEIGNTLYLAHISTAEEIDQIRAVKKSGADNIFCEITPHHLLLTEDILDRVGNRGKVNPPLRTARDNEALYQGIYDGTVDAFGTDHAPHTLEEKARDYRDAPSGFPGFETMLPLLLNEYAEGRMTLEQIVSLTSRNPSRIFKLNNRGSIKVGKYADLAVIDCDLTWNIDPSRFHTKAKYSPFAGLKIKGGILATLVNGNLAFDRGTFTTQKGREVEYI